MILVFDDSCVCFQVMDGEVAETCLDSQLQELQDQHLQQQQQHQYQQPHQLHQQQHLHQQQEDALKSLAERYASDLHTHYLDVFQCLSELHNVLTCQNGIDQSVSYSFISVLYKIVQYNP